MSLYQPHCWEAHNPLVAKICDWKERVLGEAQCARATDFHQAVGHQTTVQMFRKTGTAGGELVAESHGFSTNLFHLYAGRLMGGNRKHLELLIGILIKVELITICIWILLLNLAIQTMNKRHCIKKKGV